MSDADQNDENTSFESVEPYEAPEVERLIQGLINVVDAARPVPLSSSSMINKNEIISVLNDISLRLPDEIRAARWLLKQREDFLARTQREGDELIDLARARAGQMVQKSEVVKAAEAVSYTHLTLPTICSV